MHIVKNPEIKWNQDPYVSVDQWSRCVSHGLTGSQRTIRTRELDDMRGLPNTKVEASDRYNDSKILAEKTPPYPVLYKIPFQLNMPWIYSNWLNIIEKSCYVANVLW